MGGLQPRVGSILVMALSEPRHAARGLEALDEGEQISLRHYDLGLVIEALLPGCPGAQPAAYGHDLVSGCEGDVCGPVSIHSSHSEEVVVEAVY